jgi:hypothetical protein
MDEKAHRRDVIQQSLSKLYVLRCPEQARVSAAER